MPLCRTSCGRKILTASFRLAQCGPRAHSRPVGAWSPIDRLRRIARSVARHSWSVWSFDDLVVGDEWESPRRTITQADVVLFAGLSGDFHPIHVDHSAAD